MEIAEHITVVAQEAKSLAAAAERGGLDVPVPTCPEWDMRDLVRHLSEIHLWAAARVAKRTTKLWPDDISEHLESWPDLAVFWPDDDKLVDWYLDTNANLVNVLESAPPDLDCPTFLPAPSPLAMWARRQAHETAVHRFDAENAVGEASGYDPAFASDGIDELMIGFAQISPGNPGMSPHTMLVRTTDTDDSWHLTIGPEDITTVRGDAPADVALSGNASDLYLVLWNRMDDSKITATGDRRILDTWHSNRRVRWTT